jgi:hypothetical protein
MAKTPDVGTAAPDFTLPGVVLLAGNATRGDNRCLLIGASRWYWRSTPATTRPSAPSSSVPIPRT